MKTREEVIEYCKKLTGTYEDYPFKDDYKWAVMRHKVNKKTYAYIYEKEEAVHINVKCDPEWIEFWRNAYSSVIPGFHMNKKHWNTLILDGTIPENDIKRMIGESYDLTVPKPRKNKKV